MAFVAPNEPLETADAQPRKVRNRVRIGILCGLLGLLAVLAGLMIGNARQSTAPSVSAATAESAIVATSPPGVPTPTALVAQPTATPSPNPTATSAPPTALVPPPSIPPTNPAPVIAAPAVQPVSVQRAPAAPHNDGPDNGKGKGKGKGKD